MLCEAHAIGNLSIKIDRDLKEEIGRRSSAGARGEPQTHAHPVLQDSRAPGARRPGKVVYEILNLDVRTSLKKKQRARF